MNLDYYVLLAAEWLVMAANKCAPYAGFVLGVSLAAFFHVPEDKPRAQQFWMGIGATAGTVGPLAWFGLPPALAWLARVDVSMPQWQGIAHAVGTVAGVLSFLVWLRFGHDPRRYLEKDPRQGKGLFLGLNEQKRPVYVPYDVWRKSHVQVIGTAGAGKGVASAVLMSQALRAGEAVFVLDPKNDEWAPHVLRAEAERAGVPFYLVELSRDVPQIDLLAEMLPDQLEELFISAFSLAEKGEAADFYRIGDRKAARNVAALVAEGMRDLHEIAMDKRTRSVHDSAAGFLGKLEDLALLTSINAPGGLNLADTVRDGGCVYVIGSMRNSRVIMAQRMLFVRLLQRCACSWTS